MNKNIRPKNNIRSLKLVYNIASIVVILNGITIYVFFRDTNNILLFHYFPKLSFINIIYFPINANPVLSNMFIFNLPYGLWCLSGLLFVRAVWLTNTKWGNIYSIVFTIILMSYVFLKLPKLIPGTFDVLDLLFIGFFAFLESIIFNMFIRRKILLWTKEDYRMQLR
jgi:hypothetical protein